MKFIFRSIRGIFFTTAFFSASWGMEELPQGITAFHERRLSDAMASFLHVLKKDPKNPEAHTYVHLIAQDLKTARAHQMHQDRLEVLANASKTLEGQRRDPRSIDQAILDATQADARARELREATLCDQADVEERLGHLFVAHDLTLKILNENASSLCGQRILSVLQSRLRYALDRGTFHSSAEQYVLEGFYAYGQADYAQARTAWDKAFSVLHQSSGKTTAPQVIDSFRFLPYQKIAAAHVEENQKTAELRRLFLTGITHFEQGAFLKALEIFRRIAIADAEYPSLAPYLAQAESRAEAERQKQLSEEKRLQCAALFEKVVSLTQNNHYPQAQKLLEELLVIDPSHPQARSYLAMVTAEIQRLFDPIAAQQRYEAGIMAYASGKLDDAKREWRIAARMDPQHEKARVALSKVEKELAYYREIP